MKKIVLLAFVLVLCSLAGTLFKTEFTPILALPEERTVGVEVGDWIKYGNITVLWNSTDPYAELPSEVAAINNTQWFEVIVDAISYTNVTYVQTAHFTNDTEQVRTEYIDIDTGVGSHNELLLISASLGQGDSIFTSFPYVDWKINETTLLSYLGQNRETNHWNWTTSENIPEGFEEENINYYWDKTTGVLCEAQIQLKNQTSHFLSISFEIFQTNLWGLPVHNIDSGKYFSTIQGAINDNETLDGDVIFVEAGTYYEHVVIEKRILLIGETKETTVIDGNMSALMGVVTVRANGVLISNFTIRNSGNSTATSCGIAVDGQLGGNHCNITNNLITDNQEGIFFFKSSDNIISKNDIANDGMGLNFAVSTYNNISENNITNNNVGIMVQSSSNANIISRNNIDSNNGYGFYLGGSDDNELIENSITQNYYGVYLTESADNTLVGNEMTNNTYSFGVSSTSLSNFINNIGTSNEVNGRPIYYLVNARNEKVPSNAGFVGVINSENITLSGMKLVNNLQGVLFAYTTHSSIENVTVSNNMHGINLCYSDENIISGNIIEENKIPHPIGVGISLLFSHMNVITRNFMSNNDVGIYLVSSANNTVYHNNLINNTYQAYAENSSETIWDNGYPSGGNYWSDYNGTDADQDGIGNTPYEIDENNQDNYPLMGMFSDFKATSEYYVQTICNSSISDFQFNGTAICFNVTGENTTTGFCRICIPTALMNDTYKVFVNGIEVPHTLLPCSNSTHSYLYFTYNHSTQEVIIIPEFPTLTSMLLILILLTVAIAIRKRRLLKNPIH